MLKRLGLGLAVVMIMATAAQAHGGGGGGGGGHGGGGHGGGHGGGGYIYIPVYAPPILLPPAWTGGYDHIHTIMVVSALGNSLTLQNDHFIGVTTTKTDITDWHIDDLAVATVQKYLSPRFTFRDANADRDAIASLPNGPLNNTYPQVRRSLAKLSAEGIDAFMVIRPDLEPYTLGIQGLAYERAGGLADTPPAIWANYEIDIFDAHSLQLIAKTYSRLKFPQKPTWFASLSWPKGTPPLDDALNISADQRGTMHRLTEQLVTASLVETLRSLRLGIILPGDRIRHVDPIAPQRDSFRNYKSVAIISALGDQFTANDSGDTTVETGLGLNVDTEIEAHLRQALAKRYDVRQAGVDRARITDSGVRDDRGNFMPHFPGLAPAQDIDLYVVIFREKESIWNGADAAGLGIENHDGYGGPDTALFADYGIAILDAHTLGVLALCDGMSADPDNPKPLLTLDKSIWDKPPAQPDAAKIAQLHDAALDLMTDSLDETMQHVGITGVTFSYEQTANPLAESLPQ